MELLSNHGINSIEELDKLTVDDLKAKNFTEDEIDQIREWRSSILEANQELLEMRATIQEKVLDSLINLVRTFKTKLIYLNIIKIFLRVLKILLLYQGLN